MGGRPRWRLRLTQGQRSRQGLLDILINAMSGYLCIS